MAISLPKFTAKAATTFIPVRTMYISLERSTECITKVFPALLPL